MVDEVVVMVGSEVASWAVAEEVLGVELGNMADNVGIQI